MPRPRFARLSDKKRERILEAAAREFAAHGYADASMNKILDNAGISKGAAYYYFDDKADLFTTTVRHYAEELMADYPFALERLDAESFWPTIGEGYAQQFAYAEDKPWAFGVVKVAGRLAPEEAAQFPSLQQLVEELEHTLTGLIQRGQELSVIRSDLPDDFLAKVFIAVDDATDQWLLANWETLEHVELEALVRRVMLGLGRFLAPQDTEK
jgi:AcrR family transcriptional regulator